MKEEALIDEKRANQFKVASLESEKASLQNNLVSLEHQLAAAPSQSSVDKMRRELRILKRLEYNADDVEEDRHPEIAGGNEGDEKDLEFVFLSKLRRAEADLVTERVSRVDLAKECDSLRKSLADAEKAREETDTLVASLEKDLVHAITSPASKGTSSRSAATPLPSRENSATLQSVLDPDAPPLPVASPSPVVSPSAVEKVNDDHSVSTIIMAQRDRLRARCEGLEAERDSFKRELQAQVSASESLKTDNTKLYEKVRYLQNFSKTSSSRGAYVRSSGGAERDLDLEALEQRYEASVDPFRQFSKAERQRKLNDMSPMERTVFVVAKTVLGE
jgi:homeobox protein cut-like